MQYSTYDINVMIGEASPLVDDTLAVWPFLFLWELIEKLVKDCYELQIYCMYSELTTGCGEASGWAKNWATFFLSSAASTDRQLLVPCGEKGEGFWGLTSDQPAI